eukprot:Pgem_evm1s3529
MLIDTFIEKAPPTNSKSKVIGAGHTNNLDFRVQENSRYFVYFNFHCKCIDLFTELAEQLGKFFKDENYDTINSTHGLSKQQLFKGKWCFNFINIAKAVLSSVKQTSLQEAVGNQNKLETFFFVMKPVVAIMIALLWTYVGSLHDPTLANFNLGSRSYWAPMTAGLIWRDDLQAITMSGLLRLLGVFVGCFLAFIYAAYIPHFRWSLQIYLPIWVALAGFGYTRENYTFLTNAATMTLLICILDGIAGAGFGYDSTVDINSKVARDFMVKEAVLRSQLTCLGALISMTIATFVYPRRTCRAYYASLNKSVNFSKNCTSNSVDILVELKEMYDKSRRMQSLSNNDDNINANSVGFDY